MNKPPYDTHGRPSHPLVFSCVCVFRLSSALLWMISLSPSPGISIPSSLHPHWICLHADVLFAFLYLSDTHVCRLHSPAPCSRGKDARFSWCRCFPVEALLPLTVVLPPPLSPLSSPPPPPVACIPSFTPHCYAHKVNSSYFLMCLESFW